MFKAIVNTAFRGVKDDEVYPLDFIPGDKISGNLARVAVDEGWATEHAEGDDAPADNGAKSDGDAGTQGSETAPTPVTAGDIEIPSDWETLPWFGLKALAQKIDPSVVNKPAALAAIRGHLAAKAESNPAG